MRVRLVRIGWRWSEILSTGWEGQRAWRNEGLGLGRVLRVCLDWVHLVGVIGVLAVTVVLIHYTGCAIYDLCLEK